MTLPIPSFGWDFTAPPSGRRPRRPSLPWVILLSFGVCLSLPLASAERSAPAVHRVLGQELAVVSSCATEGLELSFRYSYSPAAGEYVVTEVVVSKIPPACDGQQVKVALSGRDMVVAAEGRALFDADGGNDAVIARFDDSSPSVSAVTGAAVVISG